MKPNSIKLLNDCIELGISRGYIRAHKHTDTPSVEQISELICLEIWIEIYAWFDFDEMSNNE